MSLNGGLGLVNKITAMRFGKGRGKRVNISLDSRFAFSLAAEVVMREGLHVGQELSVAEVEALTRTDQFHRCLNAALRYLSYRPRSEFEVKERLHRHGFEGGSVDAVLARLKEQGLVDDVAFARFWKDNRESFSPRSQRLTRLELRRKGVAEDTISQVVSVIDDDDSAYRAALGKAHSLSLSDYQSFRQRLAGYLKRRGFSYGVISHVVEQIWQEQGVR